MNLNISPDWLTDMADNEDCQIISVGGFFYGSDAAYDELIARLDSPPVHNEKLHQTLTSKAPWEGQE